ncbi:MAG TPA: replication-associated recombination protein A [Myxococcales bacterium]|nr:replication-associated recombination protein A [Myxococcales bacterium]
MELFEHAAEKAAAAAAPLADRMRPQSLDDVVGQEHACGPSTFLARAIAEDRIPSLILWGPPGSGKTTMASVIANVTRLEFVAFSAVLGGVKEIRAIVKTARDRFTMHGRRTLLFVDEIHRFNKAQQDAFLPHVEKGTVVLVGATTENPSFEVNSALLSRVRVVRLKALAPEALSKILRRALEDSERGLGGVVTAEDEVLTRIAAWADGDARRALNLLEAAAGDADKEITVEVVDGIRQSGTTRYDRSGDQHYDLVSALIKSMRGSDPDAALYYLARMIEGGENPRFIMRRLVIFAAEDISNADPRALQVAVAAAQGFEQIGMPEGMLLMAHACTFLATAPKSNRSYMGLKAAIEDVRTHGSLEVPLHIRNAPTGLMASMGYGQGYKYPHSYSGYVDEQYLPDELADRVYYEPSENGYEARLKDWLENARNRDKE